MKSYLIKTFIAIVVLLLLLLALKRKDMTYRQSILMFFYPLLMLKGKLYPAKTDILFNEKKIIPPFRSMVYKLFPARVIQ